MRTKLLKILILNSMVLSIFASNAFGKSRLYCSGKYKAGKYGCFFKDMQLYDQRKVSDMHCVPTAAAMGLSAITYGGVSYYTNSWTKKNFVYKSEKQRITNMGKLMSNSYFAAQSVTWRAFYNKELDLRFKFRVKKVECFSDFAYLGSGGFSYKSLYPLRIFYYIKYIDKILTKISSNFFAARMLVVLEKI